jgi:hypothetical protein
MSILEIIMDNYPEETFLKVDGFDEAIIGLEENSFKLIYSVKKCLSILEKQDMEYKDAVEHFYFNISGAYMGDKTPIFCNDNF